MPDGRKIPYLIELGVDSDSIRKQMSRWDWEEIIGVKGLSKHFEKPAKEASTAIKNAFANVEIDWNKALQSDAFKSSVTKIVQHANAELRDGLLGKDDAKKVTEFIAAIGDAWKEVGVTMDSKGFARSMAAFAKSVSSLEADTKRLKAVFDSIFSGKGSSVVSPTLIKTTGQYASEISKLSGLLDNLSNKKITIDTDDLKAKFSELSADAMALEASIDELLNEEDKLKDKSSHESRALRAQIAEQHMELARLHLEMKKADEEYLKKNKGKQSLLEVYRIEDPDEIVQEAKAYAQKIVKELSKVSEVSSKQGGMSVGVEIMLPTEADIKKRLNTIIDQLNKPNALHRIKLDIDDAANVIEDKSKRQYGDNEAVEDVNADRLVNKTAKRFDRVVQTVKDRQDLILENTKTWRTQMIEAMSIGANDLNFKFGWDKHIEPAADSLFNKLQEYFEQPEYALDIKFNTEKIARDLKASIEAEGIELGVGGGTASIDVNNLASALASVLFGKTAISAPAHTGGDSGTSVQKEVAEETDDAVDSSKEYVKVLDETTIHIDKVIESLREFAKAATKSNASKGTKSIADSLSYMGIDVGKIKNGASDTDIIKMIQEGVVRGEGKNARRYSLMAKDEMGKAQGASLVGKLEGMMQTYKMDPKKGSGKVVDTLAKDIMELFNINELETELEDSLIRRFEQLEIWKVVEKPGKALAALGNVRSTKKKTKLPGMEQIDQAIKYFEAADEDTDALKKLKEARQKFEENGQTDEAKAEFEKAALVFYDETKTVFDRLKDRWGGFKGVVQAEGRRPVNIDPRGAYPTRILEIPDDAVISKVDIFEPLFKTIRGVGFTGSSARRESSERKAEFEQQRVSYDPSRPHYTVNKPKPKKDIRYKDIEYDTFKTQESGRLPSDVALETVIESLEKRVAEIPELIKRIEESKESITQLEEIKQQIESEVANLKVQDLPEFQMNAFEQYSKRHGSITKILKSADSALETNDALDVEDISALNGEQKTLVETIQTVTKSIRDDSKVSQELANKIAEIIEAKKLSKEELEAARSEAMQRGDTVRADLYRDLVWNESSVDNMLASYQSKKATTDDKIGKSKNYAQKLIDELGSSGGQSANRATKEAEVLATKLIEVKDRLYAEAKTYADILNDPSANEKTRETALGKLQETLKVLDQVTGKFATIQAYIPETSLYNSSQQNNVDKWNKNYTNKEVNKLEKELKALETQLKEEEDKTKVAELKKKIANTKRNLTRLKKIVPDNVSRQKQTELDNIERQLSAERTQLINDENRKKDADEASGKLQSTKEDSAFLTKYNELLAKERDLLEEVNRLKREGADQSVIDGKTAELKQATKALDDFLKKEKTVERTAYAREQAVEYQAQLQTAYRKRSVFDRQIQKLNDDEENLNKYGFSGRVGSRALRKASDEYMASDDVRAQEEAIRQNEQLSWEQSDQQVKELRKKLREEFAKKINDTNAKQDELDRIAAERAIAEAGREPLDDIIKDLQSQKKAAMRYGNVDNEDLKNDKYLAQNEEYNKRIEEKQKELEKKQKELEDIQSDDKLEDKDKDKKAKSKQKEIDAVNQEIDRYQTLIDNRVKLMELHKQEKEESKQTPEERALLATEKLVSMKQALAQAEENVAARKAEYESAKGTENETKMLEALDNQIKKRDEIQAQISQTEKKIERLGQVTQKVEDAKDEVVSTVDGGTASETSGGLLGLIKETLASYGGVSDEILQVIADTVSKILEAITSGGIKVSTASTVDTTSAKDVMLEKKLARIRTLEAEKAASANKPAWAAAMSEEERTASVSTINKYDKGTIAKWKDMGADELIQVMRDITKSMDGLNKESVEYLAKQRELGRVLNVYKEKSPVKDEATRTKKNGQSYIHSKILAEKDDALKQLGLYDKYNPITSDKAVRDMFATPKDGGFTKEKEEEFARLKKEIKEVNATAKDNSGLKDAIPEETADETDELTAKIERLKQKFEEAKNVGYLDPNDKDLEAFKKQLEDLDTVEKRQKAIALGGVVSNTVAKNKRMYSGTTELNAATRQRSHMDARGILDIEDIGLVKEYNKSYGDLMKTYEKFKANGTLFDPNNQKTLQNLAIQTKTLGKELEKAVAKSERLRQAIDESGTHNGREIGEEFKVEDESKVYDEMVAKLKELGAEHIKVDRVRKIATGTIRHNNTTVSDLTVEYDKLRGSLARYQKQERESLTGLPAFLNGFQKKFNSIMQYLTMTMSIHQVMAQLRKGVQYVKEIDLALTELRKVTDETEETYDRFLETAAKTGERLGSTISAVTEATATFAKLGYSMEQATEMAEAAIVYKNVGDNIASTEDAADSIISTMKGFGLEATESMAIVDRFNEIGNRFAITSQGIGEALRLSASALNEGKNSLDESIALITAANEVVNDPSSVGTALKTLTLRLRGSKTELEEMGEDVTDMATTTSQLQAKLLALTGGKVDIMLDANTFKNTTQILREMAGAWEDMNDIQRASALELMGGKRQANTLSALIQNFDTVEEAIEASAKSAGKQHCLNVQKCA